MKKKILTTFILLLICLTFSTKAHAAETDRYFTGQRIVDDLSVYHFGARFYSPSLGIFIQPDKVEGINRYNYSKNNPVSFYDPSGSVTIPAHLGPNVGNYPVTPTNCNSNPVACDAARLNLYFGVFDIAALAGNAMWAATPGSLGSGSPPFSTEGLNQYISQDQAKDAYSANMVAMAVNPLAVAGQAATPAVRTGQSLNWIKSKILSVQSRLPLGPVVEKDTAQLIRSLARNPNIDDGYIAAAHFPKSATDRQSILRNGLWNAEGRGTLLSVKDDFPNIRYFSQFEGGWADPVIFRVPRNYVGRPNTSLGGPLGLAIYRRPQLYEFVSEGGDATEFHQMWQRTSNMTVRFNPRTTKPAMTAMDLGANPAHIPARFILNRY